MEKEDVISIFFQIGVVATVVIVAFLGLVLYMRYRRNEDIRQKKMLEHDFKEQMMKVQIEVQEQTFEHISKELHDNVGQLLSSSRMLLGLTERSMQPVPDTLFTANETLGEAILQLRSLSRSLDKEWLSQFEFKENIEVEIARVNAGQKLKASYEQKGKLELRPEAQMILFRIVQEAIQNAVKHAEASRLDISLQCSETGHIITVADDGKGLQHLEVSGSLGIKNMKQRTALLEGNIEWSDNKPAGTIVKITLPSTTSYENNHRAGR